MANDVVLTPMMKQFFELKAKHPDAIMLFRCGDFYETYSEDAVVASEILGITLTKRANGQGKSVEMAGFPHHALDTYLPKLIRAGKRVAICDQLEDPKLTKKLVKRGITELVTPGVAINDNVLSYKENNFLAAVHFGKSACGVAFLDISTGEFLTAEGPFDYVDKLLNNFAPKEILFERGKRGMFEGNFGNKFFTFELEDWVFTETSSREKLLKHFETKNLKGFGVEHLKNGIIASGAILQYLDISNTQESDLDQALDMVAKSSADGIYIVDSYGALYPEQIRRTADKYTEIAEANGKFVGMHAHNNQQLAFANTIEAAAQGVSLLDATMMGMGRGAGNCAMELLLSFLKNPKYNVFPVLKFVEEHMLPLKESGAVWGYDIPYLLTGRLNQHPSAAIDYIKSGETHYADFYTDLLDK